MGRYILRRLLLTVPALFGVTIVIFVLVHVIPGDAVSMMVGESGNVNRADAARIRESLGLNLPLHDQYLRWIGGALHGDLGKSLWTNKPVVQEIFNRLPITAELAILSLFFSVLFGLPAGVVSAIRQDRALDYGGRVASILGLSVPGFWIGTLIMVIPSIYFRWTPPFGYKPFWEDPSTNLQQFLPAAFALGLALSAVVMRMTRSALLEVLRQDYVRTAWAKGLRERMVLYRHSLKNALIPVVTILGLQVSALLGGTVIMESIFSLPGVGRLILESIVQRDIPLLQGNVLFFATIVVMMNLLIDLTYSWLDPRIRYG